MFVDDMTLDQAQEWLAALRGIAYAVMTTAEREQWQWDIEDLEGRIQQLTN